MDSSYAYFYNDCNSPFRCILREVAGDVGVVEIDASDDGEVGV